MLSWKPRPPSARVKERLLAAASGRALSREWHGPAWWLAPAMACLFLAGAIFSTRPSPIAYWGVASTNMFREESLFQQAGYAAYFAGAGHTYQNQSPSWFEMSFGGGVGLDGISILNTNSLIR